jgi:hypothetical protein
MGDSAWSLKSTQMTVQNLDLVRDSQIDGDVRVDSMAQTPFFLGDYDDQAYLVVPLIAPRLTAWRQARTDARTRAGEAAVEHAMQVAFKPDRRIVGARPVQEVRGEFRLPSTGELVPLLQIAPSKSDTQRLLLVSPAWTRWSWARRSSSR